MTSLRKLPPIAILSLLACCGCRSPQDHRNDSLLKSAGETLDQIRDNSQDAIPNSVLNAAKCIVTVPSLPAGTETIDADGAASCGTARDWQDPIPVRFSGRSGQQQNSALIVVVLGDNAAQALRAGGLQLVKGRSKPPLVSTKALVTDFDLTPDYLAYQAVDRKVLEGSLATGELRAQSQTAEQTANQPQSARQAAKPVNRYQASLQSFVNTIIPTGIVVHHTAVVASDKVPKNEKDVDAYHEERGMEIYCDGKVFHVAYHYLIAPDGKVERGRPERCEGAHARGYNSYLGISLIGDFSSKDNRGGARGPQTPTRQQMKALVDLSRSLQQKYNIPLQHVLRHSDISSTDCPGDRFPFNELLRSLGQTGQNPNSE